MAHGTAHFFVFRCW
ncbi:hypothetical protein CAEBREN_18801 [Caenorhabditis brenneri]|uniref:Uncharacterized protein n=1 Tax=Caenorhabditis brenneri TaxID=135651 RepID=G0NDG6_CAEBE|nr:hypothetical protein CAEBREN_18801 [Caenorhabditis brenneri]